jgi:hypothetical protein
MTLIISQCNSVTRRLLVNVVFPMKPLAGIMMLCLFAGSVEAQGMTERAAREADVATLDGIIAAFYDIVSGPAGQPRDWARDSTLYLAGAQFTTLNHAGGRWRARTVTHDEYARSAGPMLAQGFFEREIHRVVQRFGPMAHVMSTYEWRTTADGPVGGRGINSIELFHDGNRWWISYAMWADETPDTPIPAEFLPRQ